MGIRFEFYNLLRKNVRGYSPVLLLEAESSPVEVARGARGTLGSKFHCCNNYEWGKLMNDALEDDLETTRDVIAEVGGWGSRSPNSNPSPFPLSRDMNDPNVICTTTFVVEVDHGSGEDLADEGEVDINKRRLDGMVEAHGVLIGPASIEHSNTGSGSNDSGLGVGFTQSGFESSFFWV